MPEEPTILDDLRAEIHAHAQELECAYLFGSVARGEAGPLSDYDVALLFRSSVPPRSRSEIAAAIIDKVQKLQGPTVDVVILNDTGPALRHRVIRDGRPLFIASERQRVFFEAQTMSEFLDFRWVLDRYDEALLKRAREGRFGTG